MRWPVPPRAWRAAGLALGTASALGVARFAYGLLVPAMRDELHWTLAEAGAMSTANGLGYLIGALATAAIVRRWGTTVAFRAGMALTAVSLASTAAAGDYLTLLAVRAAAGAAGAVVFIAGGVIASRQAARIASAAPITVYFAGAGLGIVFSGVSVPLLGEHWRLAWLGLATAVTLATAASWAAARTDEGRQAATRGRARVRPLGRTALTYLLFGAGYISYITFLSAYLVDRHASVAQVIVTWTVLGLAVLAAPALWSYPITHWPGTRALATLLIGLAGAAALALVSPALPVILASAFGYGAMLMGVPAAVIKTRTPIVDWTATLAAFTTVFAAGQCAGPWIAGALADHTSPVVVLAWTSALCGAAALIAVTDSRPRPDESASSPRRATGSSRTPNS